ncbi:protein SAR DEFICIENT 1-like isoform X2 [Cucurbita moschata]|uniref:Protein SAR DEFICIENT 1-like isoform X2 n=1 Tax=Cucurbita moschata TaxID=3662 RepID=A0A6J1FH44_CUCMO|nr:protein SAR DEFICIENT 1-like isoform X2 [Cucurbita moschata]
MTEFPRTSKKRAFHIYHGDGYGAPNQESKRINILGTAFLEDSMFTILEPLIRRVVREETDCAITKIFLSSSSSISEAETTTAGFSMQLLFDGKLPDQIFTNNPLKAEGGKPLEIHLCYANSKAVVESGPLSSAKVDFSVISGLCSRDQDDWTEEEFNSKILSERDGKRPLLAGSQSIVLKNGVGVIGDLSITDNSSWIPNRKFILGAKISHKNSGEYRVKPARSYPFSVKDCRGERYMKHHPPSVQDEVWRLENIRKDGKFHHQLTRHKIHTVEDFLRLNETNQRKLRSILDPMSDRMWQKVLDHAKTSITGNGTVPRCPNGWDGAIVEDLKQPICVNRFIEDLKQPICVNRFDEQHTFKPPLTYRQAGPISPNLRLHPLPDVIHSQENLQICAPNTNNGEEDGIPSIFQIHNSHADQIFPPILQPDYIVDDCTLLLQNPVYYPPATFGHGNELLPSSSYAAEAGAMSVESSKWKRKSQYSDVVSPYSGAKMSSNFFHCLSVMLYCSPKE